MDVEKQAVTLRALGFREELAASGLDGAKRVAKVIGLTLPADVA